MKLDRRIGMAPTRLWPPENAATPLESAATRMSPYNPRSVVIRARTMLHSRVSCVCNIESPASQCLHRPRVRPLVPFCTVPHSLGPNASGSGPRPAVCLSSDRHPTLTRSFTHSASERWTHRPPVTSPLLFFSRLGAPHGASQRVSGFCSLLPSPAGLG